MKRRDWFVEMTDRMMRIKRGMRGQRAFCGSVGVCWKWENGVNAVAKGRTPAMRSAMRSAGSMQGSYSRSLNFHGLPGRIVSSDTGNVRFSCFLNLEGAKLNGKPTSILLLFLGTSGAVGGRGKRPNI